MFNYQDKVVIVGENREGMVQRFNGKIVSTDYGKYAVHVDNPEKTNSMYSPSFKVMYFNIDDLRECEELSVNERFLYEATGTFKFRIDKPETTEVDELRNITLVANNGEEYDVYTDYKTRLEELLEDGNKSLKFYTKDKKTTFTVVTANILMFMEREEYK